jgi:transposase
MKASIASVGIDVSKDELVVFAHGKQLGGFPNTQVGLQKLRKLLQEKAEVHLEASGGYDRLARRLLTEWGFVVNLHNARKVRRMADGAGFSAKNDQMDAQVLATVGPMVSSNKPKSAHQETLCDLSRTIKALRDEIGRHRIQMQAACLPKACIQAMQSVNRSLEREIQKLEREYLKLINESEFRKRYELALTVPAIGEKTARVLACELPEDLENLSGRQVASYAGLAPIDDQSGKRNGPKRIRKGNVHLKSAMYMPALWAMSRLDWAKNLYSGLRQKGKTHEQSIVAVMRRLLVITVAVMARGTAFQAEPPQRAFA